MYMTRALHACEDSWTFEKFCSNKDPWWKHEINRTLQLILPILCSCSSRGWTNISYIWPPVEIYVAIFMENIVNGQLGQWWCSTGCSWCCSGGCLCRHQTTACSYCMLQDPASRLSHHHCRALHCSSPVCRPYTDLEPLAAATRPANIHWLQFDQSLVISVLTWASHAPISPSQGYLENKCNFVYIIR